MYKNTIKYSLILRLYLFIMTNTPRSRHLALLLAHLLLFGFLAGCSTVNLQLKTTAQSINEQRATILSSNELSQNSQNTLAAIKQKADSCIEELSGCIKAIGKAPELPSDQVYSTLAELYLASAQNLSKQPACQGAKSPYQPPKEKVRVQPKTQTISEQAHVACLSSYQMALSESIRYSYLYLFYGQQQARMRVFSDRQIQVKDFYNQAVSDLVKSAYVQTQKQQARTQNQTQKNSSAAANAKNTNETIALGDFTYTVRLHDNGQLGKLEDFISTYNLGFSGLSTQSKREGFGVNHVAIYEDVFLKKMDNPLWPLNIGEEKYDKKQTLSIRERIHEASFLPRTIVVKPVGDSAKSILTTKSFEFLSYDPYQSGHIDLAGQSYPLAANFSAPYGLWLSRNNYESRAYISFFAGFEELSQPHLYMLEPYNPNKRVIVMLHGLASSPESWINLTNDLLGDPVLRENYQVWQVFYSTSIPMIENRYQIYSLLKVAFAQADPKSVHKASQHSVFVGHSMGAVIGRMLLSDANLSEQATQTMSSLAAATRLRSDKDFQRRFDLHAIENFDRAIFLSAPFKGTPFADKWFTKALRSMVRLPSAFVAEINNAAVKVAGGDADLAGFKSLFLDNAADQLSNQSLFMQLTSNIDIAKGVTYHSIIGKNDDKPLAECSDGVVPYTSSHLAGAASEKVIQGDHSIQLTPEAVLELRRILRLHLYEVDGVALPKAKVEYDALATAEKISQQTQPKAKQDKKKQPN